MPINPLVLELLEEVESGKTPEAACADHPDLLDEVLARLNRVSRINGMLDAIFPSREDGLDRTIPRQPPSPPEIPGHVVESVLGRGGMGVVFKARNLRLNRPVAVKMMLHGGYAAPPELARFLREAEALAAVGHPNIVQIHEAGDLDGLPYFTMEYVSGGTLDQRLGGVPLPHREAANLLTTLADAVQAAHEVGIVHRDLKPSNVLLTAEGTPKVTDFGLAWRSEAEAGLTHAGARIGTPSYMAPEQASGQAAAFGPATDVYALGAILYEMLTGRPPFLAATAAETERQVVRDDPVPPTRLNSRIPRDLETICLTCLNKESQKRYDGAKALAADLRRFLAGEPITARPVSPFEIASKWAWRHPSALGLIAAVAVVASILTTAAWWRFAERTAMVQSVEDDLREATGDLRSSSWTEARAVLERATVRLGGGGPSSLRQRLGRSNADLNMVETLEEIRLSGAASGKVDFDRSQMDRDYMKAFQEAGLCEPGELGTPVSGRIAASDIRVALVAAIDHWAACTRDPDRRRKLLDAARQSAPEPETDWRSRARDPDIWGNPTAIRALARDARIEGESAPLLLNIALLLDDTGNDSGPFLRQIQAAYPSDFWANFMLAETLDQRRDPDAIGFYRAALAIQPRSVAALVNLGIALSHQGRLPEALESYLRARLLRPDSATVRRHLADGLFQAARYEEAMTECREAIRIDPHHRESIGLMGVILVDQGRYSEAKAYFSRVKDLYPEGRPERSLGVTHLNLCDRAILLESRLPAIADGSDRWANNGEAVLCARMLAHQKRYVSAARIYAEIFAAAPILVGEIFPNDRLLAARTAAAAGCGLGEDAADLPDQERARWRSIALGWLKAEREIHARHLDSGGQDGRTALNTLRTCIKDQGFAGIREESELSRLPEREAAEWRSFWKALRPLTAEDATEAIARSRDLVARGDWAWAARGYAHAFAMQTTHDGEAWFEFAAVQWLSGDIRGYHRACEIMLDRCMNATSMRPYHAARAATLAEGLPNAIRAARVLPNEIQDNSATFWSLTERGALAHRLGRSDEAMPLLERSLQADGRPGTAVLNWLWMALAHRQLGQEEQADRWKAHADDWLARQGDAMPSDAEAQGLHLHNWLEAQILCQQAQQSRSGSEERDPNSRGGKVPEGTDDQAPEGRSLGNN